MSVSTDDTFSESRDQIIGEALANIGAIGPAEPRSANNSTWFDAGDIALNRMVKAIDPTGMRLWRIVRRTTATVAATATFTTATDVLGVDGPMRYTTAGQSTASPITAMSRVEYMRLPDRTTAGTPRNYFYETTLAANTVYLWPVPAATGDTIEYTVSLRGKDFDTGADNPDFPTKWLSCLVYGLTAELAPQARQLALVAVYRPLFQQELGVLMADDSEKGPIMMSPFGGMYGGGAG
jgi:hypothetical protein